MRKRIKSQSTKKSKIIAGALLLFIALGASGCGSSSAAAQQTNSSQTNANQTGPKQSQRNPAMQAANELRRLQNDPQMALSSDQKEKLKPILQDLINAANLTSDDLQKQADAINALLTDPQKSYLANSRPNGNNSNNRNSAGNNANGSNPNSNPSGQNAPNGNNRPNGTPNNNGNGRSFDAKTIYQQVLDLISK